jgi:hypothetical protein
MVFFKGFCWLDAVAHTCNARYSGGGDQEDHSSRQDWAKYQQKSRHDGSCL